MVPLAFINHACEIIADTNFGLSGSKIVEYLNGYAVDYDVDIPFSEYPFPPIVPNKRTALRKNLQSFEPEQQVFILNELCQKSQFKDNSSINNLRSQLLSRYGHIIIERDSKNINTVLVEQICHWLCSFPESLRVYESALMKLESRIFQRNLLDDIRLCLEKLVQALLGNNKSLENQIADLGLYLKDKGCSKELVNMFQRLVDYYTKYQNTYIKHNDAVVESEIEIIFEMTCSFMRFLIRSQDG